MYFNSIKFENLQNKKKMTQKRNQTKLNLKGNIKHDACL